MAATAKILTPAQINRLTAAHRAVCSRRDILLDSEGSTVMAMRLITECSGDESEEAIVRRFAHEPLEIDDKPSRMAVSIRLS